MNPNNFNNPNNAYNPNNAFNPNSVEDLDFPNDPNRNWFQEFPDPASAQPQANAGAPVNAGVPEIQDFDSFQKELDVQGFQPVQAAQPQGYQQQSYQQPVQAAQPQGYQQPVQAQGYQQVPQAPAQPQEYQQQASYQQLTPAQPQQGRTQQPASPMQQGRPVSPMPPIPSFQPSQPEYDDDDDDYYEEDEGQKKKDKKKLFYILFPTILAVIAALMALFIFVILPKMKDDSDENLTRRTRNSDSETVDPDETEDTDDTDDTEITDNTDDTPVITDTTPADPTDTAPVVTRNTDINGVTTYNQLTSEQLYEIQDLANSHLKAEIGLVPDIELYSAQFLGCVITSKTMPEGDIQSNVYPVYQVVVKEKSTGEYVEYFWHDGMNGINDDGSMDIQGGGWITSDFTHNGWTVRGCSTLDLAKSSAENAAKSKGFTKSDSHIDESLKIAVPGNSGAQDRAGFIFPNIDTEEISDSKIASLSADDIRIAINDICALHGVKFGKAENQARYKKYSWYKESITMDEFNANPSKYITNPIEKKNFDKLVAERQKRGGNGV